MALNTRKDFYGFTTDIRTEEIYRTSRLVSSLTGMPIQHNKAIVGKMLLPMSPASIRWSAERKDHL